MRFSDGFLPTLRDDPADAEIVSHKLMMRSGMLRKIAAGIYTWMPLGLRVLRRIEEIIREEMDRAGALEVLMPALQPAELWKTSGRWQAYGDEMMRLSDRHEREFCLGPTHEELVTTLAKELRSYKDLPKCLYQIQVKFRDEIRPRFGVMRSREFIMKDAYSFHTDQASLDETYAGMARAYSRIVERCGLTYRSVKAAGGLIGGAVSEEFMVLAETGEDVVIYCPKCEYAANLDAATSKWHIPYDDATLAERAKVHTPGSKSIDDVAQFLQVPPGRLVKTLFYRAGDKTVAALLPGGKDLNPVKLSTALGVGDVEMFGDEDFKRADLPVGYVGPVDLKDVTIVADQALKSMRNFIVGANEADHHWLNINVDRDFSVDIWADLAFAEAGEVCSECGEGRLERMRGIEVGHIFQLGTKYSKMLEAGYVDDAGAENPFVMGCYGIGVSRLVASAIEQNHDESGIVWPKNLAPFDIHLITVGNDDQVGVEAGRLYDALKERYSVVYDDRGVSAGIKFADADLIGVPLQLIIGKRFLASRNVEVKVRADGSRHEVGVGELSDWLAERA